MYFTVDDNLVYNIIIGLGYESWVRNKIYLLVTRIVSIWMSGSGGRLSRVEAASFQIFILWFLLAVISGTYVIIYTDFDSRR